MSPSINVHSSPFQLYSAQRSTALSIDRNSWPSRGAISPSPVSIPTCCCVKMAPPFRQLCPKGGLALQNEMHPADEAMIKDLKDERVPVCLYWTVENVINWIEELGFKQYKSCFEINQVDGRRLIHVTMSTLPQMGIQDYQHMKTIVGNVQKLLAGVKEPLCNRSVSLPPREPLALYLEQKSRSGNASDALTYSRFLEETQGAMWKPPTLANAAFVLGPADRIHVLALHTPRQK